MYSKIFEDKFNFFIDFRMSLILRGKRKKKRKGKNKRQRKRKNKLSLQKDILCKNVEK